MFVETKEAGEVKQAPAKVLTLSEAIRIGAGKRPQCTSELFYHGRSCALGAAYEAFYGHPGLAVANFPTPIGDGADTAGSRLEAAFPQLRDVVEGGELVWNIYSRNDRGMPREEIADWLEGHGY